MKRNINLTIEEAKEIYKTASEGIKKLLETSFTIEELIFEPNILTIDAERFDRDNYREFRINGYWAGTILLVEQEGELCNGREISGHKPSMFLTSCSGLWYTEDGNIVSGFLHFKPKV